MKKTVLLLVMIFIQAVTFAQASQTIEKTLKLSSVAQGTKRDSILVWGSDKSVNFLPISKVETNLDYLANPTGGTVFSSAGNDAYLTLATQTNAGLQSPDDKIKLDNLQSYNVPDLQSVLSAGNMTYHNLPNDYFSSYSMTPTEFSFDYHSPSYKLFSQGGISEYSWQFSGKYVDPNNPQLKTFSFINGSSEGVWIWTDGLDIYGNTLSYSRFWLHPYKGVGFTTSTGQYAYFKTDLLTSDERTFQVPDKSGTIALTSDILTYTAPPPFCLVYTALTSQTGTDSPVTSILHNDFDNTIGIFYVSTGIYEIRSNALFTQGKTVIFISQSNCFSTLTKNIDASTIRIETYDKFGTLLDDGLLNTSIEIKKYIGGAKSFSLSTGNSYSSACNMQVDNIAYFVGDQPYVDNGNLVYLDSGKTTPLADGAYTIEVGTAYIEVYNGRAYLNSCGR